MLLWTPRTFPVLALLTLVGTAGCDSSVPEGLAPNTFTLRTAGEDGAVRTPAFFFAGELEGETAFSLMLGTLDPASGEPDSLTQPAVVLSRRGPAPGVGAYPLLNIFTADPEVLPDSVVGVYLVPDTTQGADIHTRFHFAEGGTLFIDEVLAGEAMQGRYEMTVREADIVTGEPVGPEFTVQGEFNAVYREVPEEISAGVKSLARPPARQVQR